MVWLLPKTSLLQSFQLTWIKRFNAQRCNEGIKEPVRRKWGFFRQRAVCPLEKKEEQNKRGNEYNKKAVPHLWKHKSGTASYFKYPVICLGDSFLQLLTSALSYTGRMLWMHKAGSVSIPRWRAAHYRSPQMWRQSFGTECTRNLIPSLYPDAIPYRLLSFSKKEIHLSASGWTRRKTWLYVYDILSRTPWYWQNHAAVACLCTRSAEGW